MSETDNLEEDAVGRKYTKPYGGKHPIPTIQGYREHRKELDERLADTEDAQHEPQDDSKAKRAFSSAKAILKGEDEEQSSHDPYPAANHNDVSRSTKEPQQQPSSREDEKGNEQPAMKGRDDKQDGKADQQGKSATETAASTIDPREKRKAMKHNKRQTGGREVTDPVTHLPIVIHDQTEKDLNTVFENEPAPGALSRSATGFSGASKTQDELDAEQNELQKSYNGMQKMFPPPSFQEMKQELAKVYALALTVGLSAILGLASLTIVVLHLTSGRNQSLKYDTKAFSSSESQRTLPQRLMSLAPVLTFGIISTVAGVGIILGLQGWVGKKVKELWDDETWESQRREESETIESEAELPESVQWLNSLLSSVWPLINPDLFASLVDTLEDVMQASLPKVVRMVSVDDMGQGSEALRILGIRWLPTGAASQSVDEKGHLKPASQTDDNSQSDRVAPGLGQETPSDDEDETKPDNADTKESKEGAKQREQEQQAIREGMQAEEGDFVNLELAFAYRARSSGKSLKDKTKNAHLYLKFYLPGGIAVPVWVELRGIVATMRMRLQLTPDPPFFSLCTITFLGQPKASLSCVPLSKRNLNIMDVPLISSFVQSAIDAAFAEYVAPKSLTLDLKNMLVGDDFKKDTYSRGVVWVYIKQARGFKQGDGGVGPIQGSSDSYVTVSWGKFGKPMAATRIIVGDQEPNWHEWASILVSPEELNAQEKLRLQLWDSDKWTADDDLGRVEVDLKELMENPDSKNKMCEREDRFTAEDPDEKMPGSLTWSVGYFDKTRITQKQLEQQTVDKNIRSKETMKEEISKIAERKLREAQIKNREEELHQQKVQDYKEMEDDMLISAPPSDEYLSGILSIQIHNITGLEVESLQKKDQGKAGQDQEGEAEQSSGLPDSYCTIILNHRKVYKTRTKPKNAKPFFNAGTERFVKDWKSTEIIVNVRDSREREDDALLGVIYLPLKHVFKKRSQVMGNYPLAGGIGYGRARISMVWRSVELQLLPNLRGWDYGTLEVKAPVKVKGQLPDNLQQHRMRLLTQLTKAKMYPSDEGGWAPKSKKNDNSVFLAVRKRYATALMIEFRKSTIGPDKSPGFAVFWLSELVDEEESTVTLKVWKGGKDNIRRAQSSCDFEGLEKDEQALGEIEVTLKFWQGLSGYHTGHASQSKNADVRNVMECLDTITDEKLGREYAGDEEHEKDGKDSDDDEDDADASDSESSADDGDEEARAAARKRLLKHRSLTESGSEISSSSDEESSEPAEGLAKIKGPFKKLTKSKPVDTVTGTVGNATGVSGHNDSDDGSRGVRAQIRDYKDHSKQLHRKHRGIMQWKGARTLDWGLGKVKRMANKVGESAFEHGDKDVGIETEV